MQSEVVISAALVVLAIAISAALVAVCIVVGSAFVSITFALTGREPRIQMSGLRRRASGRRTPEPETDVRGPTPDNSVANDSMSNAAEGILVYHIGMVYRDLGEYQKALDNLRQSLSLWGARLDGRAYSFYAVGDVYARLGEAQQALAFSRRPSASRIADSFHCSLNCSARSANASGALQPTPCRALACEQRASATTSAAIKRLGLGAKRAAATRA